MEEKQTLMDEQVARALAVLRRGGMILYPTDTVWGIGCDATNAEAVEKIYALKKRSDRKSLIVLTDKLDNVSRFVQKVPEVAWQLFEVADKPLTLILPEARGVAENVVPDEGTIAIRVPEHEFCKRLIYKLNRPLVSTSANVAGANTPVTFSEIAGEIRQGVDYVVEPAVEGRPTRKPSSIIAVGAGGEIKIIRE
ncbi:MAG: threonylcarbamoyl-AMP synthase [Rikenellaceae bacterium]|jgi:L-threonylcarbamoyladenylate synthase|nr:threonylcarbamoyl-AMP synthase [Rikenellaceae bacterium]